MDDGTLVLSRYSILMSRKIKISAIITLSLLSVLTVYILLMREHRAVRRDADIFIRAMMIRDFNIIYNYHAPSQKRVQVAMKVSSPSEAHLKEIYGEQKTSFEDAQPTVNLKELWVEKYLFIDGMKYRFGDVKMIENIENPSSPIRERIDAVLSVEAEYTNKEKSPDLNGYVRNVTYLVKFVSIENIIRTSIVKPKTKRWLFHSIDIKEGSLVYWEN